MWKSEDTLTTILTSQTMMEFMGRERSADATRLLIPEGRTQKTLEYLSTKREINVGFLCADSEDDSFSCQTVYSRSYNFSTAKNNPDDIFDVMFVDWNFLIDEKQLDRLHWRSSHVNQLNIVFLADHHHMFDFSIKVSRKANFFVHAHPTRVDYLNVYLNNNLGILHCAALQWPDRVLQFDLPKLINRPRVDKLYGGFSAYPGYDRNTVVEKYIEAMEDEMLWLTPYGDKGRYWGLSPLERLDEWTQYKCSLVVPINADISPRIFDALITGQIPIVSSDVIGLESAISASDLNKLPIVRFEAGNLESLHQAHSRAIALFDRDGIDGVLMRSEYARKHHSLNARFNTLSGYLENQINGAVSSINSRSGL